MKPVAEAEIGRLRAAAYRVPTDSPESDGTIEWSHTGVVVVHVSAGGREGLGWTYGPRACAALLRDILFPAIEGLSALDVGGAWQAMVRSLRNAGRGGAGMMAISAVDLALWDLKARILGLPLAGLIGQVRDCVPIYGSGGFTSYTEGKLCRQLAGWAGSGIGRVKMKVGRDPSADRRRVRAARRAIGAGTELFVDANGAYSRKQALGMAQVFASESAVSWFEEPVSSDDLDGLRLLRDAGPAGMDIAAGEYGDSPGYFLRMIPAVDCLQADATRCGGITGFLKAAALCEAAHVPFSAHCAPQVHAHAGCAAPGLRHVEYFFDHARLDGLLFDGVLRPEKGRLRPDLGRAGHGMSLRGSGAERYRIQA
ncbi:MAG TPA: enolase C-terminal domain-like protein [Opitutaceae bacterium]|jgi:L-alanine-DL-glutamate epimerase-like enolase superfamily enzyme